MILTGKYQTNQSMAADDPDLDAEVLDDVPSLISSGADMSVSAWLKFSDPANEPKARLQVIASLAQLGIKEHEIEFTIT